MCVFFFLSPPLPPPDQQEYIRRQLEEEQRHLEMLQEQLLREQAMLLVSTLTLTHSCSPGSHFSSTSCQSIISHGLSYTLIRVVESLEKLWNLQNVVFAGWKSH